MQNEKESLGRFLVRVDNGGGVTASVPEGDGRFDRGVFMLSVGNKNFHGRDDVHAAKTLDELRGDLESFLASVRGPLLASAFCDESSSRESRDVGLVPILDSLATAVSTRFDGTEFHLLRSWTDAPLMNGAYFEEIEKDGDGWERFAHDWAHGIRDVVCGAPA